jgi:hypothetical protein
MLVIHLDSDPMTTLQGPGAITCELPLVALLVDLALPAGIDAIGGFADVSTTCLICRD